MSQQAAPSSSSMCLTTHKVDRDATKGYMTCLHHMRILIKAWRFLLLGRNNVSSLLDAVLSGYRPISGERLWQCCKYK